MMQRAEEARRLATAHRLTTALQRRGRANVIAEIKRASPSKGIINAEIDVAERALEYQRGGACAISVLTEEDHFLGSLDDLRTARQAVELPILRKDFIVDQYQIYESAAAGADAVLLIVAVLRLDELNEFIALCNELRIDALVEVHTMNELEIADKASAQLIGVNNRDLHSFNVTLDVSRQLIEHRPANTLMVAESGISTREHVAELQALGFNGFLVGESLMRAGSVNKLQELAV
jgi:indole-3-glycerol phosphate synthase